MKRAAREEGAGQIFSETIFKGIASRSALAEREAIPSVSRSEREFSFIEKLLAPIDGFDEPRSLV